MALTAPSRTSPVRARRDADGMAVASFVLGLIGLLLFNAVFGPCAIVLGTLAIARDTRRRGRALLGLTLGIADVVLLIVLLTLNHSVFWQFGG
ncbi:MULTISPECIES: DUF4190 domain-containing protein [Streptomyces]|uniref:DUF4190 domain-containing protein n=3 Tax=Streptomyces violaceusniger group TaxID=2839105 RepID=A0A0A0NE97_STRRN|nr:MULTISPECIES: DUF4190 domain-containing protein [Streptomyces]AGP55561.1 hypothetical protein M271_20075 [Streptomyces rapamycinicus NRRL 5491]MBB4783122.1 hypothetical protein [Streptomyces rapamycinicus]MBI0299712.1 DUF4190 domain-containing protein [Streptomyces sabulosicollis]MBP2062378.1 hypothetical protein [Streptomyces iranensis]RLV81404.1 hypothetical protein D3C57_123505 [Streptomyces rapamycinicus NRRL 5491]